MNEYLEIIGASLWIVAAIIEIFVRRAEARQMRRMIMEMRLRRRFGNPQMTAPGSKRNKE